MPAIDQPNSVYIHIGQRIKDRRKLLKLNQSELAELMGFSYQQMQKYENGTSHVSAGKILLFAKILNVPPSFFYDGLQLDEHIGKRIESEVIQKTRTEPLHILLIEDNPADVILFRKALNICTEHVEVEIIHDSEAVMESLRTYQTKFKRKQPDIIVLDLSMPGLPGMEVLKAIKKHHKTTELPVIIHTNSVSVRDMVESYRQGAAGFIQKSVDLEEYVESLDIFVRYWTKIMALPCV